MNIRRKIFLIVSLTFVVLFVFVYVFSQIFLLQGFIRVEEKEMQLSTKGAASAFSNILFDLATKLHDWSSWDDTYRFVMDKNSAYISSNLNSLALSDLNINFIVYLDTKDHIVMSKAIDLQTLEDIPLPKQLLSFLTKQSPLVQLSDVSSVREGILTMPDKTLLLAERPITTSQGTGPIRGTLIFGRYLDQDIVAKISHVQAQPVVFQEYSSSHLPQDFQKAKKVLKQQSFAVVSAGEKIIGGYTVISDMSGQPGLLLRVEKMRDIFQQGRRTIFAYLLLLGGIGGIVCLGVLLLLELFVSSRLAKLITSLSDVSENRHIMLTGNDEFARLAGLINMLTDRLQDYARKLQDDAKKLAYQIQKEQKQNTVLEDTQKAMVNILEDLEVGKARVEQEKAKDDAVLTSIGDGVVAIDSNEKVWYINPQASKLLHNLENEIVNRPYHNLWSIMSSSGRVLSLEKQPIQEVLTTQKQIVNEEYVCMRHDGTTFPIALTISPVFVYKHLQGVVCVLRDITREKELEKTKSEFLSLASHQLKTPIGIMRWYLEDLQTLVDYKNFSSKVKEYLDTIRSSTERLNDIVSQLLDVSRIEAKRVKDEPVETDIPELIQSVIDSLQVAAKVRKSSLALTVADGPIPHIRIDQKRLREVIENLLSNAIKYTFENKPILIKLGLEKEKITIEVINTGIGVADQDKEKIFGKFYRADNAVHSNAEGSGLGLYIAKQYVEGWGGRVGFASQENNETKFFIELPLILKDIQTEENMLNSN